MILWGEQYVFWRCLLHMHLLNTCHVYTCDPQFCWTCIHPWVWSSRAFSMKLQYWGCSCKSHLPCSIWILHNWIANCMCLSALSMRACHLVGSILHLVSARNALNAVHRGEPIMNCGCSCSTLSMHMPLFVATSKSHGSPFSSFVWMSIEHQDLHNMILQVSSLFGGRFGFMCLYYPNVLVDHVKVSRRHIIDFSIHSCIVIGDLMSGILM